jgi:hypothetical protein
VVLLRINRWALSVLALIFAGVVIAGFVRLESEESLWKWVHYTGGQLLVQATILTFAISLVVVIRRAIARSNLLAAFRAAVPLLTLLMIGHTCFTGYLGPSRGDYSAGSDTHIRFRFFHLFAEPALVGILLLCWWLVLGRLQREPQEEQN